MGKRSRAQKAHTATLLARKRQKLADSAVPSASADLERTNDDNDNFTDDDNFEPDTPYYDNSTHDYESDAHLSHDDSSDESRNELQESLDAAEDTIQKLSHKLQEARHLNAEKQNQINELRLELRKSGKRTTRVLGGKENAQQTLKSVKNTFALQSKDHGNRITDLETQLKMVESERSIWCAERAELEQEIEALKAQTGSLLLQLSTAQASVAEEQRKLAALVADHHAITTRNNLLTRELEDERDRRSTHYREKLVFKKRWERATEQLDEVRKKYDQIREWRTRRGDGGAYTADARWLMRQFVQAGCAEDKVGFAMYCCAQVFGITVKSFPDGRTVGRVIKEGGLFALLQQGWEISRSEAFGTSSDGTTHRGITVESRHITIKAPDYSDSESLEHPEEWQWATRVLGVERALDHTGDRQHAGMVSIAHNISEIYTESSLAHRWGDRLDWTEFYSKMKFQTMDHASDGLKAHRRDGELKTQLAREALGASKERELHDDLEKYMETLEAIPDQEIYEQLKLRGISNPTDEDKVHAAIAIVRRRFGDEAYDKLPAVEKDYIELFFRGGCCAHKDLNAFKYGTARMGKYWLGLLKKKPQGPPPVLLPNKANASTIRNASAASKAAQAAVSSSNQGGVKAAELAGALLHHKDSKKGYQDKSRLKMQKARAERYFDHPLAKDVEHFPDTSNTRYQSYSYAAANLVLYHDMHIDLIKDICSAKTAGESENHLESNVLKALNCKSTYSEWCAMALYGLLVSWIYLPIVRKSKNGVSVNLLDTIELHRRIPLFCMKIALNPSIIFDTSYPETELTLDRRPVSNQELLATIRLVEPELPDLRGLISALFQGCAEGWIQFTPEFIPGGPIDLMSPRLRALLHIPAVNCSNEGLLGSWRVGTRFHPNISPENFSARERCQRNDTEAFIKLLCKDKDHEYIRKLQRLQESTNSQKEFGQKFVEELQRRAEESRAKVAAAAEARCIERARLAAVGLELDIAVVETMTIAKLKDQFRIYSQIVEDDVISKAYISHYKTRAKLLEVVLSAVKRYHLRVTEAQESMTNEGTDVDPSAAAPKLIQPEDSI